MLTTHQVPPGLLVQLQLVLGQAELVLGDLQLDQDPGTAPALPAAVHSSNLTPLLCWCPTFVWSAQGAVASGADNG